MRRDRTIAERFRDRVQLAMLAAKLPGAIVSNGLRPRLVTDEIRVRGSDVDHRKLSGEGLRERRCVFDDQRRNRRKVDGCQKLVNDRT